MKNIVNTKSIALFALGILATCSPVIAQDHNENRDSANEYNLYERNRDDRDFNKYSYPDQSSSQNGRNRRYNNSNYYQNNQY